jgi:hypothetical protein
MTTSLNFSRLAAVLLPLVSLAGCSVTQPVTEAD